MVTDEELRSHVEQVERPRGADPELASRVERLESTARCVHDELARRIERTNSNCADAQTLSELVARVESLEEQLADIETQVD